MGVIPAANRFNAPRESEAIAMRGQVRRTVAWMTALAGLWAALWLAGAAHTPAVAQSTSPGAPVELRVAWWGSQDRHNRTIKAIELFQKKYPNIKVTYEFAGWADYWTKMTTQAAGRNLPDVMQQDYAYIAEWTSRGLIAPLDDYVKSGVIDTRDVADAALKGGVVNGKLVAVNLGSNSQCWVLDVDAFKKAGVELPPPNWTWADFEKTTMALQSKLGIWGMGSQTWDNQIWGALYLSSGQWRYTADGSKIGYESDKPLVDHFSMLLRLQKANALTPRADELASYNQETSVELTPLVSRKAAMAYFWSNQIVAVWKAAGGDERNLVLHPLPRVPGGKSANFVKPSQFFSVTTQAKQPKEAAMFIDFFTNSIEANEALLAERGVPISSKVQQALKPKLGRSQAEMFAYLDRVTKDVQPIPPPDPPGHADIVKNVFNPQVIDPVAYGRLEPDKAAALLRQEANAILAKAKR
jgi:ABC-type glycerol-3-phosphate transport system substrate-binding protein